MKYLIFGIVFYALFIGLRYLIIFQQLAGATLQYSRHQLKGEKEVPDYIKEFFRGVLPEIERLGFEFCCYLAVETIFQTKRWEVLLYNEALKTYAMVHVNALPDAGNLVNIDFNTFFEDGVLLITINGQAHGVVGEMPAVILQDPYAATLEEQWQTHKSTLSANAIANKPKKLSFEAFVELYQSHEAAYINSMVASGQVVRRKETDLFDFNLATAFKAIFKIARGSTKAAALMKARLEIAKNASNFRGEIPSEVEVEAFKNQERIAQRRGRKEFKIWLLIGSLALFVIAITPIFRWRDILILIGVLFLHESGHFLAMKLFGYQDTSIFFLPLFGAAASGRKDNATLAEKVIVLLAGPLPGLLLGAGIAIALQESFDRIPWLFSLVGWLVILNYFNLLPILPLDGGRIVDRLLFSRHPYTDVLFKIFTVGILAIASVFLHDPLSLPLGAAIAFTIPTSFRSAQILKKLQRQSVNSDDTDSLLLAIFRTIKQSGWGGLPFGQKYRMAKDILQRCGESQASLATRLSLLALYLTCLLGGFILAAIALLPPRFIWGFLNHFFP